MNKRAAVAVCDVLQSTVVGTTLRVDGLQNDLATPFAVEFAVPGATTGVTPSTVPGQTVTTMEEHHG